MWTLEKVFSYVHVDTGKDLFLCPDKKVIFLYVKVKKDWAISYLERIRDGIFPYEWRSLEYGKKNFPMNGLAGLVKEYFSMSGEAANGEILFHYDC